jgi:transcriptional regulator with XRE-family HTH domain
VTRTDDTRRSLGERIKRARYSMGLTAAEAARLSGYSQRTVRRVESGDGGTIASLLCIAHTVGLTLTWTET